MDWNKIAQGAMSSFATGGIGLGLSAVGSFIGDALSRGRMDKQADLEKSIMKYQYDLYSPENQVNRLRRAGLNVGLMYSGNGMQSGGATGSIGMSSSDPQAVGMNPLMISEMETAESVQEANRSKANMDSKTAELTEVKTAREKVENARASLSYAIEQKLGDTVIAKAKQELKNAEKEFELISQNIATGAAQERMFGSQADLNKSLQLTEDTMREVNKRLVEMKIKGEWQDIQASIAHEARDNAEAELLLEKSITEYEIRDKLRAERANLVQQKEKLAAEIANINADTEMKDWQKAESISRMVANYAQAADSVTKSVKRFMREDEANESKSDKEIASMAEEYVSDLVWDALLESAM